jgi:hypothetical protein
MAWTTSLDPLPLCHMPLAIRHKRCSLNDEARDAKNNERHVRGRARDSERPVSLSHGQ